MRNLKDICNEASILGDIDDILADGDVHAQKREIVDWLKENEDFAYVFGNWQKNQKLFEDNFVIYQKRGE